MRENRCTGDKFMQQKETTMGVYWMLVILLYCVSSHASQCPNISYGQLKFYYAPEQNHTSVFVPCTNVSADEKRFKLFKDQTMVHTCNLNLRKISCKAEDGSNLDVHFEENEKSLGFITNVPSQGIYTCETQTVFPPPYTVIPHEQVVIVHSEERFCQCDKTNNTDTADEKEAERSHMFLWIWIAVVALLSTYSLAVTILALVIRFKLKNAENQSDYMNTKPTWHRKNKNKTLNPIPRYV